MVKFYLMALKLSKTLQIKIEISQATVKIQLLKDVDSDKTFLPLWLRSTLWAWITSFFGFTGLEKPFKLYLRVEGQSVTLFPSCGEKEEKKILGVRVLISPVSFHPVNHLIKLNSALTKNLPCTSTNLRNVIKYFIRGKTWCENSLRQNFISFSNCSTFQHR